MKQPYLYQKLNIKDDVILDDSGNAIMMQWERSVMRMSADLITHNKGDVLNVGFGMGIIDSFIQERQPYTHWIIEKHPQVIDHMKKTGWYDKKNVKILEGGWEDYVNYLPCFDGIYFDTWDNTYSKFLDRVSYMLKPDGIFSYFNAPKDGHLNLYPYTSIYNYTSLIRQQLFYDYYVVDISESNKNGQRPDGDTYFPINQSYYALPVWSKKEKLIDIPRVVKI